MLNKTLGLCIYCTDGASITFLFPCWYVPSGALRRLVDGPFVTFCGCMTWTNTNWFN